MNWLTRLFGLDRTAPDQTRRKILKTAAVSPLFIPILSGKAENIDRPPSDKSNMLDFMEDVLVVTVLKDEIVPGAPRMGMSINGKLIAVPLRQQVYIQRCYVELLANSRICEGFDNRERYPFTIHHDPAGEAGQAWLESVTRSA